MSERSISEDRIGRIGDVLGFMRVKSRYLEAFGVISVWNREFVLNIAAEKESRDDPLSYQTTCSFSPALLVFYRFGGVEEYTEWACFGVEGEVKSSVDSVWYQRRWMEVTSVMSMMNSISIECVGFQASVWIWWFWGDIGDIFILTIEQTHSGSVSNPMGIPLDES